MIDRIWNSYFFLVPHICYKTLKLKGFVENGVFRAKALSKLSTLLYLINIQSLITVQGDKLSKKNKRTGRKSSSISVQVIFSDNV